MEVSLRFGVLIGCGLLVIQAIVLMLFGQPVICDCGYIKLWEGAIFSGGNSQHLTDWYTFSHIIHGFIFYFALGYFFPNASVGLRLTLALGVEIAWELAENTPMVINHYREQALAQGYFGDTIVNSISDTLSMVLGFLVARRVPVWSTVALALGMELFVLYFVRDSFVLNVINLVHVFPWISAWQIGG